MFNYNENKHKNYKKSPNINLFGAIKTGRTENTTKYTNNDNANVSQANIKQIKHILRPPLNPKIDKQQFQPIPNYAANRANNASAVVSHGGMVLEIERLPRCQH